MTDFRLVGGKYALGMKLKQRKYIPDVSSGPTSLALGRRPVLPQVVGASMIEFLVQMLIVLISS
jgi:hypothetical protein